MPRFTWLLVLLLLLLALPYLAQRIQYGITRGELKAQHEVVEARSIAAGEELKELSENAQLVKLTDTSRAFRLVAQRIGPSVVHIDVLQARPRQDSSVADDLPFRDPQQGGQLAQGTGSGVVMDKEGYILTNYHVVRGAQLIQVKLSNGETTTDVQIRGYDMLTDLALLKINVPDLVAAAWGDSDALEVGDWVLAVGNPFGLDRTVTAGIVSAKQRRGLADFSAYQDFLQTDAAVNPGNSGGPLVNVMGEVVGINTAIVGSGYQGISFAIPSSIVRDVYDRLKDNGKVARGWLGVALEDLSPQQAVQLGAPDGKGAIVTNLVPGGPAELAGIRPGDIILEWNSHAVLNRTEMQLLVGKTEIGSTVQVVLVRGGEKMTVSVTVAERESDD